MGGGGQHCAAGCMPRPFPDTTLTRVDVQHRLVAASQQGLVVQQLQNDDLRLVWVGGWVGGGWGQGACKSAQLQVTARQRGSSRRAASVTGSTK